MISWQPKENRDKTIRVVRLRKHIEIAVLFLSTFVDSHKGTLNNINK